MSFIILKINEFFFLFLSIWNFLYLSLFDCLSVSRKRYLTASGSKERTNSNEESVSNWCMDRTWEFTGKIAFLASLFLFFTVAQTWIRGGCRPERRTTGSTRTIRPSAPLPVTIISPNRPYVTGKTYLAILLFAMPAETTVLRRATREISELLAFNKWGTLCEIPMKPVLLKVPKNLS